MKPIDLIEELLSEYSHIILNGRLHRKDFINFSLLKHQNRRRLDSSVSYQVKCNRDQVSFISKKITSVNIDGSTPHLRPKEYVLLNVDLKHPRSIVTIRQFLEHLR